MATLGSDLHPSLSLDQRVRQLGATIRWAPAPLWGTTTGEHLRYGGYLAGSILGWTALGLAMAAIIGAALGVA
jgi:hypothetical protein